MKIDDEAVEILRDHDKFSETNTDKLFIIDPISEDGKAYYVDLRNENWQAYGYKGDDQVELPTMKPSCLKEVKSKIRGRGSKTLDKFSQSGSNA